MGYYKVAILGKNVDTLTYKSQDILDIGTFVFVKVKNQTYKGVVVQKCEKPSFTCKSIDEITSFYFNEYQLSLAKFISTYYVSSFGIALNLFIAFDKNIKYQKNDFKSKKINLSSAQQNAKTSLLKQSSSLLFGDTGSGKTEIYMDIMSEFLNQGKNVIFLMPEISLTPQMKKRLISQFGQIVGIWHSKITAKKKQQMLQGIQSGQIKIIAGARSALFLPICNIGAIIVDEEHDSSYKSSSSPRYNAKDTALMYAKILNANIILGSATPSLNSFYKINSTRLKETFYDTRKNYIFENEHNKITPFILQSIKTTLDKNEQIIVFVPTRANFKYLTCKACGQSVKCPFCDVGMSLYNYKNIIKCHYCGYTHKIPQTCEYCGGDMLEANRIGTAEVAKILKENFKDKNIQVFDKDSARTQTKLKTLLKNFNDHKIDILVGTQMLSKGHDYHKVTKSIILGLDSLLWQSDFKARENALSLAIQIAGRSGRAGAGEVLIQTLNEEFFKSYINEYEKFLNDELEFRKELYPPFMRLLRILISHKSEDMCARVCDNMVKKINSLNLHVEVVGYGKSNIEKIANKFRYEVLIRSNSTHQLVKLAHLCKNDFVQIDMDPISFS